MESVYQEIKKILRHGTVVHKAAYISYLAFLYFSLYLFDDFGSVGGIVYQYIRIARNLDAITAFYIIAREDNIQISLDDILYEHQIIVVSYFGQLYETWNFAVRLFHYEILRTSRSTGRQSFLLKTDGKIQTIIAQK